MAEATVLRTGVLAMQVCIPKEWTDEQVTNFANTHNPAGTMNGWMIRKDEELLRGDPERRQCEEIEENVHIMLDC